MTERICIVDQCGRPVQGRGYCNMHYKRLRKAGELPPIKPRSPYRSQCSVDGCARLANSHGWCLAHWRRWRRSGDVQAEQPLGTLNHCRSASTADLFWRKVDQSAGPDGCWSWRGYVAPRRRAYFRFGGRSIPAARVAFLLTNDGAEPPVVRHACDNELCVNPAHLRPGTHEDNMRDMRERGRAMRGEQHVAARLRAEDVVTIRARAADGERASALAREYGVSRSCVDDVVHRKNWRHIA